ncbi:hypothetical protein GCM10010449_19450 [Streptomyces rectiviolaceus]|uniref:Uncharacterized protein n=1 Tax=Streptomyces rectiviolaceus TaxID=332591 RepID=A0ABP6MCK5_9ACTN
MVVAGRAAAEHGERAIVVDEIEQVRMGMLGLHGVGSFSLGEERPGPETLVRKTLKAAPRAAFASLDTRRISGPPDERATTSFGLSARACSAP